MDNSGVLLTPEDAKAASEALQLHIKTFCWLALCFHDRRLLYWKVRPKTHVLFHMSTELVETRINPSIYHTFEDESFLGKIKAIASKVHGRTLCQRVFERYFLVLALFFDQEKRRMTALNDG